MVGWFDVDFVCVLVFLLQSEDKTLRLVNQMWHVLVKEDGNEQVRDTMVEWMMKRK